MASGRQLERGQKCDGLSVWRPGWGATRQRTICETAQRSRLTIVDGQRVNIGSGQAPAIFGAAGGKGDTRAVWRPCRFAIVPVAVGQLLGLAAMRVDQEEMATAFVDVAHPTEP